MLLLPAMQTCRWSENFPNCNVQSCARTTSIIYLEHLAHSKLPHHVNDYQFYDLFEHKWCQAVLFILLLCGYFVPASIGRDATQQCSWAIAIGLTSTWTRVVKAVSECPAWSANTRSCTAITAWGRYSSCRWKNRVWVSLRDSWDRCCKRASIPASHVAMTGPWRAGCVVDNPTSCTSVEASRPSRQCDGTYTSVAVLAEISLRSPRKLFIFIIEKYNYRIKVSKKQII